jgi:hypothetical protein
MPLHPCAHCGCFVAEGSTACPHSEQQATSLGRKVVHATVIAMVGAATSCVSTPLYGAPATDDFPYDTGTADTSDTGDLSSDIADTGSATDTGTP